MREPGSSTAWTKCRVCSAGARRRLRRCRRRLLRRHHRRRNRRRQGRQGRLRAGGDGFRWDGENGCSRRCSPASSTRSGRRRRLDGQRRRAARRLGRRRARWTRCSGRAPGRRCCPTCGSSAQEGLRRGRERAEAGGAGGRPRHRRRDRTSRTQAEAEARLLLVPPARGVASVANDEEYGCSSMCVSPGLRFLRNKQTSVEHNTPETSSEGRADTPRRRGINQPVCNRRGIAPA